jgi:hypothetical protein
MDRPAGGPHSTKARDLHDQGIALIHVLAIHPVHTRLPEVLRELTNDPDDFSQRDAIERAVIDLVGAGLLFRCEELLLPTRAALRFDEIFGEAI